MKFDNIVGISEIDDRAAEQCSGGFNYTVNFYAGTNGTGGIVKSVDITEKSGYDVQDLNVSDKSGSFGLDTQSFSIDIDGEPDGDGYRLSTFTSHNSQNFTVDPNQAYNFAEGVAGLGLKTITVNKVNTSYRGSSAG